jgi:hypothetical protein
MPNEADPWLVEKLSKILNEAIYEAQQTQEDNE